MEILDAHNHFWLFDPQQYGWISEEMAVLKRDYLAADMEKLVEKYQVTGTIAVQARQNHEENHFLLDQSKDNAFVKGVVGWVDLTANDVEKRLQTFARFPNFVGIRHMVQSEPDDQFLLRKDFQRGVGLLKEYNLAYDILIHDQLLPVTTSFVNQFPDQKFVLDHIAKPPIKSGEIASWKSAITTLAQNSHVHCKISGLVTEADWHTWTEDDLKPYLDVVFEAFGPERLMYGSDWPVCLLAADYSRVLNLIQSYITQFEAGEQERIMRLNAMSFYNL